jgi:hypothetical protein
MSDRKGSLNDFRAARLLRLLGAVDLLALIAVFMPLDWMSWINVRCGLDGFPEGRLVGYLTRTTSALYALHGALILFVSTDVDRYRPLVRFMGCAVVVHGVLLFAIDLAQSMPWYWTLFEGPVFSGIGIAVFYLTRAPSG